MVRQVINKKQTKQKMSYEYPGDKDHGRHNVVFDKDHGYHFSDDVKMDNIVNYFLKQEGFELVGEKKTGVSDVTSQNKTTITKKSTTKKTS